MGWYDIVLVVSQRNSVLAPIIGISRTQMYNLLNDNANVYE